MKKVYVKFPKTGLGNMMLVWARGVVFARLNNIDYVTSSWWGLRWGALLRQEQRKRLYWGYFKEASWTKRISLFVSLLLSKKIVEPSVSKIEATNSLSTIYIFNKVITDNDLFGAIRNHKEIIAKELDIILTPKMKSMISDYATPVIGVHIRRGDFKMGNPITPLSFFIEGIKMVRKCAGSDLPVTVFTDATNEEIVDIMQLPNVDLAVNKPDILDIILLSKSKILFLSKSSSFSYWGAFLSDALVVRPVNDWQEKIRESDGKSNYREYFFDEADINKMEEFVAVIDEGLKNYQLV